MQPAKEEQHAKVIKKAALPLLVSALISDTQVTETFAWMLHRRAVGENASQGSHTHSGITHEGVRVIWCSSLIARLGPRTKILTTPKGGTTSDSTSESARPCLRSFIALMVLRHGKMHGSM